MSSVFEELTLNSQRTFSEIRRRVQFFSTFAGGVIEALRESGYRLSNFQRHAPRLTSFHPGGQLSAGSLHAIRESMRQEGVIGGECPNIELDFEQRDNDMCRVLIIPYRTDLPFLSRNRFTAQLGLELSRYTSDPDVLRKALNVNTRGQFGAFLGGARLPKLYPNSPPTLRQPGSMSFELQGARLVVAINLVVDLSKYRVTDFDLDVVAIGRDLNAYFYGLEKYLSLLLHSFGADAIKNQTVEEATPDASHANTVRLSSLSDLSQAEENNSRTDD